MRILPIIAVLLLPGRAALAADSLAELIAAVELAESHYSSLKLDLTSKYSNEAVEVWLDPGFQQTMQSETYTSIVLQDSRFCLQRKSSSRSLLEDHFIETTHVFDGHVVQSHSKTNSSAATTGAPLRSDSRGQISDEHPSLTNLARPHMLLLEVGCPKVPLSTYLKGHAAVRAHPNPGYFPEQNRIEVHDLGAAEFAGLRCHRILIDSMSGDVPYNGWELWLAEERNHIPVRNVSYTYRWSKDVPVADAAVDEWLELRPGVWFPMKAHTDRFDSRTVKDKGQKELSWRREYEVRSVSLEPETTPATFTELEFPPGTNVRVFEKGVEVTK